MPRLIAFGMKGGTESLSKLALTEPVNQQSHKEKDDYFLS
jgi:hypothetical protein